jgi:hypothetical protein
MTRWIRRRKGYGRRFAPEGVYDPGGDPIPVDDELAEERLRDRGYEEIKTAGEEGPVAGIVDEKTRAWGAPEPNDGDADDEGTSIFDD